MLRQPMWKTNLAICVTLVALVAGYFFYQVQAASEQFRNNSREHSKVLAAAVELNIRNAMLSNDGLELIITDFLNNSAQFIAYLNIIEQFTATELSAFAREAGLAGITIISDNGKTRIAGPENWGPQLTCDDPAGLVRHEAAQLYSLIYGVETDNPGDPKERCVIVGFSSRDVDKVQEDISVQSLLDHLGALPGIDSVELVPADLSTITDATEPSKLVEKNGQRYSETRIRLGDRDLIVTQVAGHFAKRLHQMRTEFFLFVAFLVAFGALSSWWLYYGERLRLKETREYEQQMARQHEAAALGRAAATIAHEIRNPLNAIGMGLQRLQLEAGGLDEEHRKLLLAMREAVTRSNTIITSLQQYVRAFSITPDQVDIAGLMGNVVQLYAPVCADQGVEVVLQGNGGYTVAGDRGLLGQVFENVVKNAVEAQPKGGYCHIHIKPQGDRITVVIQSGGFTLTKEESDNIFEPYFTTKTQGTGLGLAISRKIVEAHGGTITATPNTLERTLTLVIELPVRQSGSNRVTPSTPTGGIPA
ncbi:sensor histidine kinase [Desulfopila aestuarii]|uniref:histidine kinase n=1 Tax=Desulfopila aestuarii DSM 18488 TaxID=1121416 RepID=A0A1M7Y710_9BACT|nr:HAMP domain-containing sensor histidine kinase [Desulfopila aestuarii]SHO48445.1 Signal transduction histidine kinase [Desulfopila aestuarii DSM 18488]